MIDDLYFVFRANLPYLVDLGSTEQVVQNHLAFEETMVTSCYLDQTFLRNCSMFGMLVVYQTQTSTQDTTAAASKVLFKSKVLIMFQKNSCSIVLKQAYLSYEQLIQ